MQSLKTCKFCGSQTFRRRPNLWDVVGGRKKMPVGDGFAIAQPVLLQNKSNNETMAACSSSRLHFLKEKLAKPHTKRNCILLCLTNIRLFYIASYFIFSRRFTVIIVSHRTHEDAHLICLNFVSCHVH
jgi:hypothetical protein